MASIYTERQGRLGMARCERIRLGATSKGKERQEWYGVMGSGQTC